MPWHLPDDFKYFKQQTLGKPIVMGRKTFESIGSRPLPGRQNIVLSKQADFEPEGVTVLSDLEALFNEIAEVEEAMIIGGAQIYQQFLPLADRLYLTEVNTEIEADAHFPAFDPEQWQAASREFHPQDERHAFPFEFVVYHKAQ
jgi:dihydrofolate reductase